jgi:S1-C subfamily serine protease
VILSSNGIIATNYHVIKGAVSSRVKLQNGDIYDDVLVLDTDERKDIAIIKIKASNLPYLIAGNSDSLKIGANVYAIGAPRRLQGSISAGIVSGIRASTEIDPALIGFRIIQFTAPVSSGSSGGALLTEDGKLIGLVFASREGGQNLNLAIPINYVSPLAANPHSTGKALAKLSVTEKKSVEPKAESVEDIAGVYAGGWASNDYNVSGAIILTITIVNGVANARADFTGSEYFSGDVLEITFTKLGTGIWKMDYKGKKSKIKGTGIFKDNKFIGDYKFRKLLWTDTGKWVLNKTE